VKGFRDFVLRGNIVDLAVAVVIGVAFSALVKSFTTNLLDPLIGLFGGQRGLNDWVFDVGTAEFTYGAFLSELINFLITAGVVYFLVIVPLQRLLRRLRAAENAAAPKKECPECLSSIPTAATRCAFCTATLASPATSG